MLKAPKDPSIDEYVTGIKNGNITILSKAITLLESKLVAKHKKGQEILTQCLPNTGKSQRIGITGVPGVGKSTFIEAFGTYLSNQGKRLAVLAIDPSSTNSKGSILGDKTRMENLSQNDSVYIRPSPSSGTLGGVANATKETILLCEAAGFDYIIVETVGVGQSEIEVHNMVDFFLLLLIPGAGDELQGIKRGIMEMADGIVINKADGDNLKKAKMARQEFKNALHLFPMPKSNVLPQVIISSALESKGMEEASNQIENYLTKTRFNGYFSERRRQQQKSWFHQQIDFLLKQKVYADEKLTNQIQDLEEEILKGSKSPYNAAQDIINNFLKL